MKDFLVVFSSHQWTTTVFRREHIGFYTSLLIISFNPSLPVEEIWMDWNVFFFFSQATGISISCFSFCTVKLKWWEMDKKKLKLKMRCTQVFVSIIFPRKKSKNPIVWKDNVPTSLHEVEETRDHCVCGYCFSTLSPIGGSKNTNTGGLQQVLAQSLFKVCDFIPKFGPSCGGTKVLIKLLILLRNNLTILHL